MPGILTSDAGEVPNGEPHNISRTCFGPIVHADENRKRATVKKATTYPQTGVALRNERFSASKDKLSEGEVPNGQSHNIYVAPFQFYS